jgi:hypothetical protein
MTALCPRPTQSEREPATPSIFAALGRREAAEQGRDVGETLLVFALAGLTRVVYLPSRLAKEMVPSLSGAAA